MTHTKHEATPSVWYESYLTVTQGGFGETQQALWWVFGLPPDKEL